MTNFSWRFHRTAQWRTIYDDYLIFVMHLQLWILTLEIAYDIGGGFTHGHLAIGNGAVKMASIIDTAKASETRPSNSRLFQNLFRRYEEQVENNQRLTQRNAALTRHVKRTDLVVEVQFYFSAMYICNSRSKKSMMLVFLCLQFIAQKVQIEIDTT